MSINEEKLLFSLTESVWFKQGMAVTDIRSLSLEPIVNIEEKENLIVMKGYLQLYGEYDPDLTGHLELEKDSLRDVTGERTLQEIHVDQNGIWTLKHQFPLDVEIPKEKVTRTDNLGIRIQMFDYELLNERCLEIKTDIEILGIGTPLEVERGHEQESEIESIRSEFEEELAVYKTQDPQIYAEMNTRETEEITLEQVSEQLDGATTEIQEVPETETSLYIHPMPAGLREEEAQVEWVEENSELDESEEVVRQEEDDMVQTPEEEIPALTEIENRLNEMEEVVEWHTADLPPRPRQPAVFHFQSNIASENEPADHMQSIQRIDLSELVLADEHSENFVDNQAEDGREKWASQAIHAQDNYGEICVDEELIRKEVPNPNESAMQVEKYNLAGSPKKVQVEEAEQFFQQEETKGIVEENMNTQQEEDVPVLEENALYLAKLFQSKEEKRARMKIYFVQQEDSVQSLAIKFNVPIHHIHKFNQLEDDELKVGDAIYIPTKSKQK